MKSLAVIAFALYVLNACAQNEVMNDAIAYAKSGKEPVAGLSADIKNPDNEFINYIKQVRDEIAGNDKRIAALKAKLLDTNKNSIKSEKLYKKREKNIIILEVYNNELKTDLNNYLTFAAGDWKLFKKEFNRELEELGKDIADLKHEYEDFIAVMTK